MKRVDFARGMLRAGAETLLYVPTHDGIPAHTEVGAGKTASADRGVHLPAWLLEQISVELADRPKKLGKPVHMEDYLFLDWRDVPAGRGQQPLSPEVLRQAVVRPALRRAGLPERFRNYDLRHTYASLLFQQGHSPIEVGASMGHSEPSVSQNVYGHLYQGWQEKLGNEMDRLRQEAEAKRSAPPEVVELDQARRDRAAGD